MLQEFAVLLVVPHFAKVHLRGADSSAGVVARHQYNAVLREASSEGAERVMLDYIVLQCLWRVTEIFVLVVRGAVHQVPVAEFVDNSVRVYE